MKRPLIWISLCFAAGIILEKIFNFEPFYYYAAAAAVVFCALALIKWNRDAFFAILALAVVAGGLRLDLAGAEKISSLAPFAGEKVHIEGAVKGTPEINEDRARWRIKVDRLKRKNEDWLIIPEETVMVYYFFDRSGEKDLFLEPGA
ncbi:MAG: DUF4131 domain-containing protein [Clostridia bacterium]|nr:DUF4131 domain-containing protein [Clostridia bacterium]